MKKLALLSLLLLIFSSVFAYDFVSNPPEYNTIDTNPAGISYFGNGCITYERLWTKNNKLSLNDEKHIFLNFRTLGYALKIDNSYHHTLASSHKLFKNFYVGDSYNWDGKKFKEGSYNTSFLYRPLNMLSVGCKLSDIFDRKNHKVDLGLSIRPIYLSGDFWNRFDIDVASSYYQGKVAKPAIGIRTELIDGITIKGDYNLENEEISMGFSLNFGFTETGINVNNTADNTSGSYFIKTSTVKERTFVDILQGFVPGYYKYNLAGKIGETHPDIVRLGFFQIKMGKYVTLNDIKRRLKFLGNRKDVKGIIIENPKIKVGISDIQELKSEFDKFRAKGKKVIFYFDYLSPSNYIFAAAFGDEIYLNPTGELTLPHLGVKSPYLKNLLDKLGINVQNLKSHKYKTAGNMFSETEMTEAEKETYKALLEDISKSINEIIEENRGMKLTKSYKELVDMQPFYTAQEAEDYGLIDGISYQTDFENKMKRKGREIKKIFKAKDVDWAQKPKSKVAIIYAVGNIHMGKGQYGKSIGAESIRDAIKKARTDKSVKGIIIRVNSGGGSALASDIIAHEVELAKTENKKPVVISMGRVAASGGYYISALADKIIAQPATITGSIGVIGMIPEFSKLYKKIGVNWSTLNIDKFAGYPPTERAMTDKEKKYLQDSIHHIYWEFVGVVAKGRNKDKDDVHKIAQGRVWSGLAAYNLGLVDELGGLDKAKEEIKKLAHLKHEIQLVEYRGKSKNMFSQFGMGSNIIYSLMPKELKSSYDLLKKFSLYKDEPVLLMMPAEVEIEK